MEHQVAEVERLGQDIGKKNKLISGLRDEIREHNNVQKSQSETIENLKVGSFLLEVFYQLCSICAQFVLNCDNFVFCKENCSSIKLYTS